MEPHTDYAAKLFPTAVHGYGYTPHHMDFPGTVTLRWNVFVAPGTDHHHANGGARSGR
jgi:creatinine amidohydrolase/Fe(II)-dependent formamide hydrolase-like protein